MPLYNVSLKRADNDESWATQVTAQDVDKAIATAHAKAYTYAVRWRGAAIVQRAGHAASDAHFQTMFGEFQK